MPKKEDESNWIPPSKGWKKYNIDACLGKEGTWGLCTIFRESKSEILLVQKR